MAFPDPFDPVTRNARVDTFSTLIKHRLSAAIELLELQPSDLALLSSNNNQLIKNPYKHTLNLLNPQRSKTIYYTIIAV